MVSRETQITSLQMVVEELAKLDYCLCCDAEGLPNPHFWVEREGQKLKVTMLCDNCHFAFMLEKNLDLE